MTTNIDDDCGANDAWAYDEGVRTRTEFMSYLIDVLGRDGFEQLEEATIEFPIVRAVLNRFANHRRVTAEWIDEKIKAQAQEVAPSDDIEPCFAPKFDPTAGFSIHDIPEAKLVMVSTTESPLDEAEQFLRERGVL